jgi:hypothetical protein
MSDRSTKRLIYGGGVVLLIVLVVILYKLNFFGFFNYSEATVLGAVVLIGLALVVLLMAVLAIIYSGIGVANGDQPLGLPEGSVRALIAFSLLLTFVLMAAFLYTNISSSQNQPWQNSNVSKAALEALDRDYVVISKEQMKDDKGQPKTDADNQPLYNVTYYGRHSKEGDDLAKQIFTTLATVFVSVVSFYFGASAATSGAGTIAKAIGAASPTKPSITKFDPASLSPGATNQRLKVIGSRLSKVTKVTIGTAEVTPDPKDVSENLVIVQIPDAQLANSGSLTIVVVGENGEASGVFPVK